MSERRKFNCCTCSLSAFCVTDAHNTISCITVCPACSTVSVPIPTCRPKGPVVEHVIVQGVHEECVARIMTGCETTDKDYRCPKCGFKKGRSPYWGNINEVQDALFMRKVRPERTVCPTRRPKRYRTPSMRSVQDVCDVQSER